MLVALVTDHRPLAEQKATRPLPFRAPVLDSLFQVRAGDAVNATARHDLE